MKLYQLASGQRAVPPTPASLREPSGHVGSHEAHEPCAEVGPFSPLGQINHEVHGILLIRKAVWAAAAPIEVAQLGPAEREEQLPMGPADLPVDQDLVVEHQPPPQPVAHLLVLLELVGPPFVEICLHGNYPVHSHLLEHDLLELRLDPLEVGWLLPLCYQHILFTVRVSALGDRASCLSHRCFPCMGPIPSAHSCYINALPHLELGQGLLYLRPMFLMDLIDPLHLPQRLFLNLDRSLEELLCLR